MSEQPVSEHLVFYRRLRIVQWIGRAAMALIVILGLAGLFGNGPFSTSTLGAEGGTQLTYSKYARRDAPDELNLEFSPAEKDPEIILSSEFVNAVIIEQVTPQPEQQRGTTDGLALSFHGEPRRVRVRFRFLHAGQFDARLGVSTGDRFEFSTFVYP